MPHVGGQNISNMSTQIPFLGPTHRPVLAQNHSKPNSNLKQTFPCRISSITEAIPRNKNMMSVFLGTIFSFFNKTNLKIGNFFFLV
jgi:hypothetical protein